MISIRSTLSLQGCKQMAVDGAWRTLGSLSIGGDSGDRPNGVGHRVAIVYWQPWSPDPEFGQPKSETMAEEVKKESTAVDRVSTSLSSLIVLKLSDCTSMIENQDGQGLSVSVHTLGGWRHII